jgi:subtilisin-like proprotein convertase family protein
MKIVKVLILMLCSFCIESNAQVFSNNTKVSIPDGSLLPAVNLPIYVSGLPSTINMNFGLKRVGIKIHHTYAGDLNIMIKPPTGGDSVRLMWGNGSSANMDSIIYFQENSATNISGYNINTFQYYPVEILNKMNNGRNPNGNWTAYIKDKITTDTGYVEIVSLEFGPNPPLTNPRTGGVVPYVCSVTYPHLCVCRGVTDSVCFLLPDLTLSKQALDELHYEEPKKYFFGSSSPNIGVGPMTLLIDSMTCLCDNTVIPCASACTGVKQMIVSQKIYKKLDFNTLGVDFIPIDTLPYDTVRKIALDKWVVSKLLLPNRDTNPANWIVYDIASHHSDCIYPVENCKNKYGYCRDSANNVLNGTSMKNFNFGDSVVCKKGQSIPVGKIDTKEAGLPGLDFDLPLACNGDYYISTTLDIDNKIREESKKNNSILTKIQVRNQGKICCTTEFRVDTTQGVDSLWVQFADSTVPLANSWKWYFGDGDSSTEAYPKHHYMKPGKYTVTLSTNSEVGCKYNKTKVNLIYIKKTIIIDTVKKDTVKNYIVDAQSKDVSIFPNPVENELTIDFMDYFSSDVHIEIADILGNINTSISTKSIGGNSIILKEEVQHLASGTYFLKVKYSNKEQVFKFNKF